MNDEFSEIDSISKPSPGLYVVATPIGHSEDITLRAIATLKAADRILCEDTRVTKKLLSFYGIKTPLSVYNDFSDEKDREFLLRQLQQGDVIALVSDAGTPLISDPGYKLIQACQDADIYVTSLPGACAAITALTVSGLPSDRFLFEGFLPNKSQARQKQLALLATVPASLIFYEAARRLQPTLVDMIDILGAEREACVARELTKKFEEVRRGTLQVLNDFYIHNGPPKGEVVIVVGPPHNKTYDEDAVKALLREHLTDMRVKDAAHLVAGITGWPKKDVYKIAITL